SVYVIALALVYLARFRRGHWKSLRVIEQPASAAAEGDLAEVPLALHVAQRLADLDKRKHPIDDRLQAVQSDCAVHGLEHVAAADVDALDADVLHEGGHGVD